MAYNDMYSPNSINDTWYGTHNWIAFVVRPLLCACLAHSYITRKYNILVAIKLIFASQETKEPSRKSPWDNIWAFPFRIMVLIYNLFTTTKVCANSYDLVIILSSKRSLHIRFSWACNDVTTNWCSIDIMQYTMTRWWIACRKWSRTYKNWTKTFASEIWGV